MVKFKIRLVFDSGLEDHVTDVLEYNMDYVGNNVERGLYFENFEDYKIGNDYNIAMAEQFQNYILNFESVILNKSDFNPSILQSPSERLFFNWLQKVGGIRFKKAGLNISNEQLYEEDYKTYLGKTIDDSDYILNPDKYLLERTVQYIGNIDTINKVEVNGDTFGEVYLYIPSSVGATPKVLFKNVQDENYRSNETYTYGSEKIVGRENFNDEDKPVDGISLQAIYDGDDGGNYYLADKGFCIDFDDYDYKDSNGNSGIDVLNQNSYLNFEFNCVLIYYDLIEKINDSNYSYATNLYGVLFLDNFKRSDISKTDQYLAYIDGLPKFRSSELDDGNSFALKVDLKIDTLPSTTMTREVDDTYVDPNDTKGFGLYMSALEELHKCIDIFYTQQHEIYELQDRVESIESILYAIPDYNTIQTSINEIKQKIKETSYINLDQIEQIVSNNTSILNQLIKGGLPTKLAIDTSVIHVENGLEVVDSVDENEINIKNTLQKYNYIGKISLNNEIIGDYIYPNENVVSFNLMDNTNLILLGENETEDSDISLDEQLVFNININNVKWRNGQSVQFITTDDFKFNRIRHNSLKIQTTLKSGRIITIKEFNKKELTKMKLKNEIEVVCINDDFLMNNNFITIVR